MEVTEGKRRRPQEMEGRFPRGNYEDKRIVGVNMQETLSSRRY